MQYRDSVSVLKMQKTYKYSSARVIIRACGVSVANVLQALAPCAIGSCTLAISTTGAMDTERGRASPLNWGAQLKAPCELRATLCVRAHV